MEALFVPIQFDKSHLSTIGERLYTQSLDLMRELVANSYDADATEVKITINQDSIIVEDNGVGMDKDGLGQYFTIGSTYKKKNQISKKFKRSRIGEFGVGKFASLSVCDRFEIYTKSGSYAATLIFDRQDFESRNDWNVPLLEHNVTNQATGTRVSLFNIKRPILISDVERHLINIFPLNTKNFSIFVNENKLQPKYHPGRHFKIKEEGIYGPITGEIIISSLLLPKESVGIGIRVKGVLIKRETFDIENRHSLSIRRLTGEINADFLPITSARNEFITDTNQYKLFYQIMSKKLRAVIRMLENSAQSYQDKKSEKVLSDALSTIKEALKKNFDILLLEGLPLFSKEKQPAFEKDEIKSEVIATALSNKKARRNDPGELPSGTPASASKLKESLKDLEPKLRSKINTLLRDDRRVVKSVQLGGNEFLVSFAHLGEEEKESFTEGGMIFINRDHKLFKSVENKSELVTYHLIRLVTQEIIKLSSPKDLEVAFEWQGKLINDAFLVLGK